MKAICIVEPGRVEIRDIEKPVRKPGEALLKLLYGGICGSDLGSYRGGNAYVSYPRVPGHEFSAEIVEIDDNDLGLKPGMIVTCNPYFNCGSCYSCKRSDMFFSHFCLLLSPPHHQARRLSIGIFLVSIWKQILPLKFIGSHSRLIQAPAGICHGICICWNCLSVKIHNKLTVTVICCMIIIRYVRL